MSRTDLGPTTLAASLRHMAGDGSTEWVYEPMQTRVLLDVADMLDENAKLRELVVNLRRVIPRDVTAVAIGVYTEHPTYYSFEDAFKELGFDAKE